MSDEICLVEQDLCEIVPGDTLPFLFEFEDLDGNPANIVHTELTLVLARTKTQKEPDLQKTHVFPDSVESHVGKGSFKLLPEDTMKLAGGVSYHYRFLFREDEEDVYTIGYGILPTRAGVPVAQAMLSKNLAKTDKERDGMLLTPGLHIES